MVSRLALAVCLIQLLRPSPAAADGSRIESRKTMEQAVEQSPVIATARVLAVRHKWGKRQAYGQVHRYVQQYSVKVKIDGFLRGAGGFDTDNNGKRTFWIDGRAHGVPGKWVLLRNYYGSDTRFARLKRGDRFIVYFRSAYSERGHLEANEIDDIAAEPAIARLIATVSRAARVEARARLIEAGSKPTCEAIDTYRLAETCASPADLVAAHRCGRGQTATMKLADTGSLSLLCVDRRGRRDGPFVTFRTLGARHRAGTYRRDQLDGAVTEWSPAGEIEPTICYRRGKATPCRRRHPGK